MGKFERFSMFTAEPHEVANQTWDAMATTVTHVVRETRGVMRGTTSEHKECWWWNEEVKAKIRDKQ